MEPLPAVERSEDARLILLAKLVMAKARKRV
jgi:hypothetical protein